MHRVAFVSALIAPIVLIGGWTVAASRQGADYDSMRDTISALAAHSARDRWIMTCALALLGLCHVVTAAGMVSVRPAGRLIYVMGGLATVAVAIFAQPSAGHAPAAAVAFVALTAWPALSGVPTFRVGVGASVLLSLALAVFGVALLTGCLVGLVERVLAGLQALWPLCAVALTARLPRSTWFMSEPSRAAE